MLTFQHDSPRNRKSLTCNLWLLFHTMIFPMSCGIENPTPTKKNNRYKMIQELAPSFLLAGIAGLQQRNARVQSMVSTTGKCHTCIPKAPAKRKQDSTGMKQHAFTGHTRMASGTVMGPNVASLSSKCIEDMLSQPLSCIFDRHLNILSYCLAQTDAWLVWHPEYHSMLRLP